MRLKFLAAGLASAALLGTAMSSPAVAAGHSARAATTATSTSSRRRA